jgi:hypothetical protein
LLHLQCHIGLDTLSWARRGAARVVGLDFSEPAVEVARDLASDLGFGPGRASFVAADVYDAATAVPDPAYGTVHNRSVEWQHPIGEVVTALAAGLRIDFLHEHDVSLFQRFESFEVRDGYYRFPVGRPGVPLMYSLRASKV